MDKKELPEITLTPIGVIHNNTREPTRFYEAPDPNEWRRRVANMKAKRGDISEIVINEDLTEILDGIEEFSHLLVKPLLLANL